MVALADSVLDEILALQITIAWAGEHGDPPRLRWWNTDLVDEAAGGDLFRRLLPRTGAWASLASVREVARRVDASLRHALGEADRVRTVFSHGFELDERLDDRLRDLKRRGVARDSLPWPLSFERFSLSDLRTAFRHGPGGAPEYVVVAGGRQLKQPPPDAPLLAARHLAAVLFATDPVPAKYPLAFYRAKA